MNLFLSNDYMGYPEGEQVSKHGWSGERRAGHRLLVIEDDDDLQFS